MTLVKAAETELITDRDRKQVQERLLLFLRKLREMKTVSFNCEHLHGGHESSLSGVRSLTKLFDDLANTKSLLQEASS